MWIFLREKERDILIDILMESNESNWRSLALDQTHKLTYDANNSLQAILTYRKLDVSKNENLQAMSYFPDQQARKVVPRRI